MSDEPRLFCLDTVLVDVILKIDALPARAGDVLASEQLFTPGGGFNAMSAAARHHQRVVYAGRLGVGPFATLALDALEREQIAVPMDRNEDLDTGICVVLSEPDGERTFVTSRGAEMTVRALDFETLGVRGGDFVLVSGYNIMGLNLADVVLGWVQNLDEDVVVCFDPATRAVDIPKDNFQAMLARSNWLLCNANEIRALTGSRDVIEGATSLASSNETLGVVARTGADGCVVIAPGTEPVTVAGFATTVVDTTGAGDVHNGVFIAELASGHDTLSAARWANAAAAMAISHLGGATCPLRAEVAAWMHQS
jgi:sugar/nucleoside kinase (ribokinase family)